MNENPYQAPKAEITFNDPSIGQRPIPASKGIRFANLILDYFVFIGLGMVAGLLGVDDESVQSTLVSIFTPTIYYIVMEGIFGRTIGKMITGTKVVDERGMKASFGKILGRTFSRLIPFEAFSFLGAEGRGWHDSLPGTYVVKAF